MTTEDKVNIYSWNAQVVCKWIEVMCLEMIPSCTLTFTFELVYPICLLILSSIMTDALPFKYWNMEFSVHST